MIGPLTVGTQLFDLGGLLFTKDCLGHIFLKRGAKFSKDNLY